jgi:hypothetical protein
VRSVNVFRTSRANRAAEIAITETMIDRIKRRFDLHPQRPTGDSVYGAVRLLKWLVDCKITPYVPVWHKSARHDGSFSRADFVFDQERNVYICPGSATSRPSHSQRKTEFCNTIRDKANLA